MKVWERDVVHELAVAILLFGVMSLTACTGGYTPLIQGGAVTIELSSSQTPPLFPGESTNITATVYDQGNQGVIWSISPLNFGTLSNEKSTNQASINQTIASVTFTLPANYPAATTVTITATSISNPTVSTSMPLKAVPLTIALAMGTFGAVQFPASPQTVNPGDQLEFTASVNNIYVQGVTWTISPSSGAGSIVPTSFPNTVMYVAPAAVTAPTPVTLIAAYQGATAGVPITIFPSGGGPNVAAVTVDGGPVPGQSSRNRLFTAVTICSPGSNAGSTCQTIDGILVDTGSSGLRILQSQLTLFQLPTLVDANGNTLENCMPLLDGSYVWGPVSQADVYIGSEKAAYSTTAGGAIQVISSTAVPNNVPTACSNGGIDRYTPQLLGANGILGIGPEPTDCTVAGKNYCDGSTQPVATNRYFSCPSVGCSPTDSSVIVSALQQVTNPVALSTSMIGTDNNGVILDLPAVSGAESAVTGRLIFGIGTKLNNSLGNATIYTLDSEDYFTTIFNGQTLTSSFIDSGASALLFPGSLSTCSANIQYYCPSSATSLSAVNKGASQGQGTINFTVDNADNLFSEFPDYAAFSNTAGPEEALPSCSDGNTPCAFVWGLPFFYGRTVYTAIDGQTVNSAPSPPWWAY
jgi:Protein of unknown function (DUF3443)